MQLTYKALSSWSYITGVMALVLSLVLLVRKRAGARAMWPRPRAVARNVRIGAPMAASGVLFSGVYLAIARVLSSLGDGLLGAALLGNFEEARRGELGAAATVFLDET